MLNLRKYTPIFLVLAVAFLIGSMIRFAALNTLPVFADESIYVRWSQVMKAEAGLRFLPLSDGKQPLYMWAVIPVLKFISDPLAAGRLVSGLCGIATAFGIMLASWILFKNRRISLIATVIWLVLPYAVFFERLALADAMLAMFIIWTFNFMALAFKHLRLDMSMLAGFCLGFAWLTKSPAMVLFGLLPLLFFLREKNVINKVSILKSLGLLAVTYAIGYGLYNILRLGPEFHMIAIRNRDYIFPLSEVLQHPLDPLVNNLKAALSFYWYLATPVGVIFILSGLLEPRGSHKVQRIILGVFLLCPILIQSAIAKTFTARYILYTVPFATIIMAHAIEHLGQHTRKHFLVFAGIAAVVLPSLWFDVQLLTTPQNVPLPRSERSGYLEEWTAGFGLKQISQEVIAASKLDTIVVGAEGSFGTPFSALQIYTNKQPNIQIVDMPYELKSVPQNIKDSLQENKVYLVVNSTRFKISDPENSGLKLITSYPKAVRPDGSREYTLFFELTK